MSYPTAQELARRLREQGGAEELATAIARAAEAYRCPDCAYAGGDPLAGLVDTGATGSLAGRVVLACPICSPAAVRAAYGLETPQA